MPLTAPSPLPRAQDVLAGRRTIGATSVDEAHATISNLFCEHRLDASPSAPVRMQLRSLHAGPVGVDLLDYGAGVQISPPGLEHFHLVQIPLAGRATMQVGDVLVQAERGSATLPPLDRDCTMRWSDNAPHLIVYVSRAELVAAAQRIYGLEHPEVLRLSPRMDLMTPAGQAFVRSVLELHDALEQDGDAGAYGRRLASELMVVRLLGAVDHSVRRSLDAWSSSTPAAPARGRGDGLARRYLALVEEEGDHSVGVLDLAERLGVPLRTLQEHVSAHTGSTPSAVLRDARFRRAHELLQSSDATRTTVTTVAQTFGFAHLGRFSVEYRKRYGVTPAQTLRG